MKSRRQKLLYLNSKLSVGLFPWRQGEFVCAILEQIHFIHSDCFPRGMGQWWNVCHLLVKIGVILHLACVYTALEHVNRQVSNRTNTGRSTWLDSLKWMRSNLLQVTYYWILKDRLPYTLNQSMQARRSNYSSKRNKQEMQHHSLHASWWEKHNKGKQEVRVKVGMYKHEQQ
jgi:hypothetical protein